MRVCQFLQEHHVPFERILHPPAFSAQKRAKVLHVRGREVAKTVLLAGPEDYILAVLPATHQVDTAALSEALGGPVRLASDTEIADVFRDCEWGVVAPFGSLYGLPTVIDETLDPEAMLVFEGALHVEAIRMRCADFERLERPVRLRFGKPAATAHAE
ncbi:MAG: aminoacyl-tRNA deacylase [Gemmataceae bacterium]